MPQTEEVDRKAMLAIMGLMYWMDTYDELKSHPVYGGIFKGSMKSAANTIVNQYDRSMDKIFKSNFEAAEAADRQYKAYSNLNETAFKIKEDA